MTYRDDTVMRRCANIAIKEATHFWIAEETEFTLTKLHDMNRTQYFDGRKHRHFRCVPEKSIEMFF